MAFSSASMAVLIASLALLVSQLVVVEAARAVLQTSGSCPRVIPGCDQGRCSLYVRAGRQQNVCERCTPPYVPSKNGLQCICPPGRYQTTVSNIRTCAKCGYGFFCKGGKQTAGNNDAAAEDIGVRQSCIRGEVNAADTENFVEDRGLTTKTEVAKKHTDCVPMPGFFLSATTEAAQVANVCPPLSYSPGYSRIRQCLKCQSGTAENTEVFKFPATVDDARNYKNTTHTLRADRNKVCQVPPGRYLVQNVVRECPAGTFRRPYSMVTEESAKICYSCPPGITTSSSAATSEAACNVVGPGVSITGSQLQAAQTQAASIAGANNDTLAADFNSTLCDYGFYYGGGVVPTSSQGTCQMCPEGTTTQQMGSTSMSDCMVPPGYYLKTTTLGSVVSSTLFACPGSVLLNGYLTGFYRAGWVGLNDSSIRDTDGTRACTKCGDGILSTPRDIDETNGGNSSSRLVAASSFSCYIEAGWGITPTGQVDAAIKLMTFNAVQCATNSYGVQERTYGLLSAPCKPCQRNLVTVAPGATSWTQCVNPNGYGYDASGATACPQGYYASAGSLQPCTKCAPGRTTFANPAQQVSSEDCVIADGYGVNDGDWVITGTTQLANLTALPCPIGMYGANVNAPADDPFEGTTVGWQCQPCPDDKWTRQEGSMRSECTVCKPGNGLRRTTGTDFSCNECPPGTWSDGTTDCKPCPATEFIYISSRKKESKYVANPFTLRVNATGPEECVPQVQQFGIDVGQKIINTQILSSVERKALLKDETDITNPDVMQCIAKCDADQCCFAQFQYNYGNNGVGVGGLTTTCQTARLPVNNDPESALKSSQSLVFTKLVYADFIAAASVGDASADAASTVVTTESASASSDGQVKAKAMSSGLYSRCNIPSGVSTDAFGWLISEMPVTDAKSLQACKTKCDATSTCWGFIVLDKNGRKCQLRSGQDEINTRSFFSNPTRWPVEGLKWY